MNYLISTLIALVLILFLYAKSLYNDNKQLEELSIKLDLKETENM